MNNGRAYYNRNRIAKPARKELKTLHIVAVGKEVNERVRESIRLIGVQPIEMTGKLGTSKTFLYDYPRTDPSTIDAVAGVIRMYTKCFVDTNSLTILCVDI